VCANAASAQRRRSPGVTPRPSASVTSAYSEGSQSTITLSWFLGGRTQQRHTADVDLLAIP